MIESKFDAIARQELRSDILQMMILRIFSFFKGLLHFINKTCQMGERTRYWGTIVMYGNLTIRLV